MATPNRINSKNEEELLCATCHTWFVPKDGQVDVLRVSPDDPGDVICRDCRDNAASRGIIEPNDQEEVLCRCNSTEHQFCPIHLVVNP